MLRTGQRVVKPLQAHAKGVADLVVPPRSKPVIQYGPPGRSAVTGHVATVFGASGFLARYLISKLAKAGTQVIVPYRDEYDVRHLKPMGDLGQVIPMEWDIRNPGSIEECVRHSDIVYNLVGRDHETKNFSFDDVNVKGARTIAEICAAHSVSNLIQVSHLNASHDSASTFYRTKAEGEDAVREVFPNATIVRPAGLFGHEDKLLNSMAFYPILWTLNHAATRTRPVHVLDVAQALSSLISLPSIPGANPSSPLTLNLPGPTVHSYASLLNLIASVTYRPGTRALTIPKPVALAVTKAAQLVWWPLLSPDEVERRYINDKGTAEGEEKWMGDWDRFGIVPEEVENVAITYLRRFRSAANFTRPVLLPVTRGTPEYHVLD